jgi:hypothetical protein
MILIFYKNGWRLCSEKVRYIQHGEEIEQYVGSEGKEWWLDFEEKWEHTEIIEFIPVEPTQEQLDRFEEINQLNIKEGFGHECSQYVEFGIFPEGFNHILRPIQILKQQDEQDTYLVDNDFRLSLIEMGVSIGDL